MKCLTYIVRASLTLALIYGAYTETGIWTAFNFFCIWVSIEIQLAIFKTRDSRSELFRKKRNGNRKEVI